VYYIGILRNAYITTLCLVSGASSLRMLQPVDRWAGSLGAINIYNNYKFISSFTVSKYFFGHILSTFMWNQWRDLFHRLIQTCAPLSHIPSTWPPGIGSYVSALNVAEEIIMSMDIVRYDFHYHKIVFTALDRNLTGFKDGIVKAQFFDLKQLGVKMRSPLYHWPIHQWRVEIFTGKLW